MDRRKDPVTRPLLYIEIVIAIVLIIGGLYILSPFFIPAAGAGSGALHATLSTKISLDIFGGVYASTGVLLAYGILAKNRAARRIALFLIFLVLIFTVILSIASNGLRPITWLSNLAIAAISGVLWQQVRGEDNGRY